MSMNEFIKVVRKELKSVYPSCKFSVRENFGFLDIMLISSTINPFSDGIIRKIRLVSYADMPIENNSILNEFSKSMFRTIKNYMDNNYDSFYALGIGTDTTKFYMKDEK